ncbi:MAG TPA: adenylate kinase [Armatimonadota bacterium]|nr:adenylate kinase [Armatimonadota bacterium]
MTAVKPQDTVLLGAPGAGKGTQAAVLRIELSLKHISTGDILRANIASGTELGTTAKQFMDHGDLVPDDVVVAMVEKRLQDEDCLAGVLFDGFPRTLPQAKALDEVVAKLGRAEPVVLAIEVPDTELIERLSGRRVCRKCASTFHVDTLPEGATTCTNPDCDGEIYRRDDDAPESVTRRLEVYAELTQPLLDYYSDRGSLVTIDGTGRPQDIAERAMRALNARE